VQLVTWNDYGEGTIIEPTAEFGYLYLEIIQEARREMDNSFGVDADALRLSLRLFQLRRRYADNDEIKVQLDIAFDALVNADILTAQALLDDISLQK
jgi:hypothetical protein